MTISVFSLYFRCIFCISGEAGGPEAQKGGGPGNSKRGLEETKKLNTKEYTDYIASLTKKNSLYFSAMYILISEHTLHGCETNKKKHSNNRFYKQQSSMD